MSRLEKNLPVISLVRHNGHPVLVNADLIETVERSQDGAGEEGATEEGAPNAGAPQKSATPTGATIVTLTTGNVLAVTDSPEAIRAAVVEYRRSIGNPLR